LCTVSWTLFLPKSTILSCFCSLLVDVVNIHSR
jgi:hypothetical protein